MKNKIVSNPPSIGIAFGAGGARGIAHLLMIEALDELGVKPSIIAGSSIGAVVGACLLYTSPSPRDRTRSRMPSSA